jgi:hypothetical protein
MIAITISISINIVLISMINYYTMNKNTNTIIVFDILNIKIVNNLKKANNYLK